MDTDYRSREALYKMFDTKTAGQVYFQGVSENQMNNV